MEIQNCLKTLGKEHIQVFKDPWKRAYTSQNSVNREGRLRVFELHYRKDKPQGKRMGLERGV